MKKVIILMSLLFMCNLLFSEEIKYSGDLVRIINFGNELGSLGFRSGMNGDKPRYPVILENEDVLIKDNYNNRINIYDKNLFLIDSIPLDSIKNYLARSSTFFVDENYGYYGLWYGAFVKSSPDGEEIYRFQDNDMTQFPESFVDNEIFWLYQGYVLYYLDSGEAAAIDPDGNLVSYSNIDEMMIAAKSAGSLYQSNQERIDTFLQRTELMMIGNKLLSQDFDDYCAFWTALGNNEPRELFESAGYFGHDQEDNSYWMAQLLEDDEYYWWVFSPTGEILDQFLLDMDLYSATLAPNGDIWAMITNEAESQFEFYRFKRHFLESRANQTIGE